jgi:hypothetical protein
MTKDESIKKFGGSNSIFAIPSRNDQEPTINIGVAAVFVLRALPAEAEAPPMRGFRSV